MATARLVNLTSRLTGGFSVQTSAHPGGGRGGTCFGDSGGPVLHGGSSTIVAVTSFALNGNCRGVDFAYRTDTAAVLAWIRSLAASVGEDDAIEVRPLEALEPRG
jgi:secreted trypsin-like serine protease